MKKLEVSKVIFFTFLWRALLSTTLALFVNFSNISVSYADVSNDKNTLVDQVWSLMQQRQWNQAKEILEEFVSSMPKGWSPVEKVSNSVAIAYWTAYDFTSCSPEDAKHYNTKIT